MPAGAVPMAIDLAIEQRLTGLGGDGDLARARPQANRTRFVLRAE